MQINIVLQNVNRDYICYTTQLNEKVSLYHTENGHSDHADDSNCSLSREIKEFTNKKFQCVQKLNAILQSRRKSEMTEAPKSKLVTYLAQLRSEEYSLPTVSDTGVLRR